MEKKTIICVDCGAVVEAMCRNKRRCEGCRVTLSKKRGKKWMDTYQLSTPRVKRYKDDRKPDRAQRFDILQMPVDPANVPFIKHFRFR